MSLSSTKELSPQWIHKIAARNFIKKGVCNSCGKKSATDMAFKYHPKKYTVNPDDYQELCRSCHLKLDSKFRSKGKKLATIFSRISDELNERLAKEIPPRMKGVFISKAIETFIDSEDGKQFIQLLNEVRPSDARTA